jgi:hypothetical protein
VRGQSVVVTGVAAGPGADVTRALWYEGVEGAANALDAGATTLTREVTDESGNALRTQTDPVKAVSPDPHAPLTLSGAEITRGTQQRAASLDATVVATHYVPLFGGTAEVVVQPNDPVSFAETASTKINTVLGPLGRDNGAYLVTIVDSTQAPLLVLGWVPGVGGTGQGMVWEAPNIRSDTVIGRPLILPSS